jgi:beta-glucosidase
MWFPFIFGAIALLAIPDPVNGKPTYKNPDAKLDDRVADLLKRMSVQEKASQLIQGDMQNFLNITDGRLNQTGLEWSMTHRGNAIWTGVYTTPEMVNKAARIAQDYQMNNTELG